MTMTRNATHAPGWACSDCLMLLANGETPPEMNEDATSTYLDMIGDDGGSVTLGRHTDDCGCDDWDTDEHRDGCERLEFSWSRCDVCRRPDNAGERHAVTFWQEVTH